MTLFYYAHKKETEVKNYKNLIKNETITFLFISNFFTIITFPSNLIFL